MSKSMNATPKALVDDITVEVFAKALLAMNRDAYHAWLALTDTPYPVLRAALTAALGARLKAQPAPVPLAEDEALIADLEYIAQDEIVPGVPGIYARQILAASARLSLRSGQLAQVLALCDDAESTKQAKECITGGGVICIQVPEIRAAIEGSK